MDTGATMVDYQKVTWMNSCNPVGPMAEAWEDWMGSVPPTFKHVLFNLGWILDDPSVLIKTKIYKPHSSCNHVKLGSLENHFQEPGGYVLSSSTVPTIVECSPSLALGKDIIVT